MKILGVYCWRKYTPKKPEFSSKPEVAHPWLISVIDQHVIKGSNISEGWADWFATCWIHLSFFSTSLSAITPCGVLYFCLSWVSLFNEPQESCMAFISLSTVLGFPLFLFPSGVQWSAVLVIVYGSAPFTRTNESTLRVIVSVFFVLIWSPTCSQKSCNLYKAVGMQ